MRKMNDIVANRILEKHEARKLAVDVLKTINGSLKTDWDKFDDKQLIHMLRSDIAYIKGALEKQ